MDADAGPFARIERFAQLVGGDAERVPLDLAPLAMASALRRGVNVDGTLAELDRLADGCSARSFEGLRRYLFDELRFGGDRRRYDDPRNSFLDSVVARRAGLPILLATVMIEVGGRAGIPVVGIGMPLHFLVRDATEEKRFADPFTGAAMTPADARRHLETISEGRIPWDDHHLDPTPSRQIVIRMLTNLQGSYVRRRDRVRVALVARMRAAIPELADEQPVAIRLGGVFN